MKDYNGFTNENNNNNFYKTKEELDSMSKEDMNKVRYKVLADKNYDTNTTSQEYIKELGFYMDVRFREDQYDMYQRWKNSEDVAAKFMNNFSSDTLYKLNLSGNLPKDNIFKHITPMIFPDDIDLNDLLAFKPTTIKK